MLVQGLGGVLRAALFHPGRQHRSCPRAGQAEPEGQDRFTYASGASMNNPDKAEVLKAEAALSASKKRFDELDC